MKKINFLLVGLAILFAACGDDERSVENTLRFDGDNLSAPLLPADTYEAAARFPANLTASFVGQNLTEVSYFISEIPLQTTLRIYSGGTENVPGQMVYEATLTGTITQNAFNAHVLTTPLEITGEDLWCSIRFRLNRGLQAIGCDAGPRDINGDRMFQESTNEWTSFSQFSGGESINWNIRGVVGE